MYRRFHRKRKNYRRYWNKEEWKKKQLLKQGYRYYIPSLNKAFKNYDEMIEFFKKVGDSVKKGDLILRMRTSREDSIASALEFLEGAVIVGEEEAAKPPLIIDVVE